MKLTYFLVIVVASITTLFSCDSNGNDKSQTNLVTVTGEILNPYGDSVWINIYTPFGNIQKKHGSALDSTGKFELSFDVGLHQSVRFYDGNETTQMFVKPGDQLHLTLDTKEFDETIKYSGIGSGENNYLAVKYLEFDDKGLFFIYNMRDSLGVDGGIAYMDSIKELRLRFLQKYIEQNQLSHEFVNWEKTNIEFEYPSLLFQYTYNRHTDSTLDKINRIFGSYIDVLPLDTMADQYGYYLNSYPSYLYSQNIELLKNNDTRDSVMLGLIISSSDGYAKNKMLAEKFVDNILDFKPEYLDRHRDVFDEHISIAMFKEIILSDYEKTLKLLEAEIPQGAKLIDLENENNKNLAFQDIIDKYRGKVIYLDFWSSWCAPCKREMPFSLDHQEYFKDKDVAFVYFSSDKDSVSWKNMVKVLQITGDHYRLNKPVSKVTKVKFDVRYIPRYVLFDKEGKVVDAKAKHPSNPEIIDDIEKLL